MFVASVSGLTAAPMHAAYGAAKAGLMALVKSAAVELGPSGIRVNAVAPAVWTPRISALLGEEGGSATPSWRRCGGALPRTSPPRCSSSPPTCRRT